MSGKRKTRETSEQQGSRRSKAESRVRSIGKQLKQKHMNILLIHGLNTPENPSPYGGWITAIEAGLKNSNFVGQVNPTPMNYNQIFIDNYISPVTYAEAAAELIGSTLLSAAAVPATEPPANFKDQTNADAGMVAQWVIEQKVRSQCSDEIFNLIRDSKADVIFAHSLGTLLCYDFFTHDPRRFTAFNQGTLVTFGSQINNPFVRNKMWPGQIQMIPVARWINIYNPHDPVFVVPLNVPAVHFYSFTPVFGNPLFDGSAHEATANGGGHPGYLDNPVTESKVYPLLAGGSLGLTVERNIELTKLMSKIVPTAGAKEFNQTSSVGDLSRQSASVVAPALKLATPRPWKRRGKHTYRYHPPRADHPLLKSAPTATKLAEVPTLVDLRNRCGTIRNQGSEGACSGFAAAAFRETSYAAKTGALLSFYLAPAYLYGWTRIDDGTFPQDSGASLASEFVELQNRGVCPEIDLPYTTDPSEGPNPVADTAALPFRIQQPLQVDWKDPQALKSVLASEQTIAIGFTVYESFEQVGANGVVPMPNANENLLGGHAVLVCGYNDEQRCWIVRNSWGQSWGDKGYCYMPYGYELFWTEAWTGMPTA
jgi:C1A family cysteine protease